MLMWQSQKLLPCAAVASVLLMALLLLLSLFMISQGREISKGR